MLSITQTGREFATVRCRRNRVGRNVQFLKGKLLVVLITEVVIAARVNEFIDMAVTFVVGEACVDSWKDSFLREMKGFRMSRRQS